MEIELLYYEGGELSSAFTRGHVDKEKFNTESLETIAWELGEDTDDYENAVKSNSKPQHVYGKKVGRFEDGRYKGWTLKTVSEVPKNGRGYFPITISNY